MIPEMSKNVFVSQVTHFIIIQNLYGTRSHLIRLAVVVAATSPITADFSLDYNFTSVDANHSKWMITTLIIQLIQNDHFKWVSPILIARCRFWTGEWSTRS